MDTVFPAIIHSNIGWEEVQAVNARDLWLFLDIWDKFSDWIKPKIQDYDEWYEYTTLAGIPEKGRPSIEYILSLDTAKNIAMMQKNNKWKIVRRYFLECERRAKINNIEISVTPRTYEVVMQEALLLADHKVKELEKKIQIDAPKVAFATAIEWSSTSVSVWDWIKAINNEWSLKMWRNKAFDWFRKNWYLMKDNVPYQKWIDQWLFELKEWLIVTTKGQIPTFTCLLTWKWQMAFIDKIWK